MHTTVWLGMSINGMIADNHGAEEFLSDNIWDLFVTQVHVTKSVIMGRKAYEALLKFPKEYMEQINDIKKVVLTTNRELVLAEDWLSVESPENALKILEKNNILTTTIAGGSQAYASFLKEKLVNEIIYAIEPVIKGEGITSLAPCPIQQELNLVSVNTINEIVLLKYKIAV